MKAVIIDDISLAIETLKADIADYCPEIKILGTADGVVSGAKLVKKLNPEIIFLDIEMNDGTGFDLLELLHPPIPKVIFTTGSHEYAIKAFRYAAIDYLLKPIEGELLAQAVQKAKSQHSTSGEQVAIAKSTINDSSNSKLALNTQKELKIVEIADIIRCESFSNYTTFFLKDTTKVIVTKPLKEYDLILSEKGFLRTHQSHLVNKIYIHSYQKKDGGYLLLNDNESRIPVSVRKKSEIIAALKNAF